MKSQPERQFAFRLAHDLHMTVSMMLRSMSAHEFAEWQIYYQIEPRTENRVDYLFGMLASILANVNRNPKKRTDPFRWFDFIPWIKPPKGDMAKRLRAAFPRGKP